MTGDVMEAGLAILVLEDEPFLLEELAMGLSYRWPRVLTASSAAEAALLIETSPDVAVFVTDMRMPGETGLSLGSRMYHARAEAEALEVVLISGGALPSPEPGAPAHAPMAFVLKPFRMAEMHAAVSQAYATALRRRAGARGTEPAPGG